MGLTPQWTRGSGRAQSLRTEVAKHLAGSLGAPLTRLASGRRAPAWGHRAGGGRDVCMRWLGLFQDVQRQTLASSFLAEQSHGHSNLLGHVAARGLQGVSSPTWEWRGWRPTCSPGLGSAQRAGSAVAAAAADTGSAPGPTGCCWHQARGWKDVHAPLTHCHLGAPSCLKSDVSIGHFASG